MPFSKVAWLLTVAAAVITAFILLLSDYQGYAAVFAAIAAAAAINLR
ncbi:MAG: hypothetical protein ACJ76K_09945 [Solirubrobacteraceae bacterium]